MFLFIFYNKYNKKRPQMWFYLVFCGFLAFTIRWTQRRTRGISALSFPAVFNARWGNKGVAHRHRYGGIGAFGDCRLDCAPARQKRNDRGNRKQPVRSIFYESRQGRLSCGFIGSTVWRELSRRLCRPNHRFGRGSCSRRCDRIKTTFLVPHFRRRLSSFRDSPHHKKQSRDTGGLRGDGISRFTGIRWIYI